MQNIAVIFTSQEVSKTILPLREKWLNLLRKNSKRWDTGQLNVGFIALIFLVWRGGKINISYIDIVIVIQSEVL